MIIHYPKSCEAMEKLKEKVSVIHAHAAAFYIQKLNCPKENKAALIKELCGSLKTYL